MAAIVLVALGGGSTSASQSPSSPPYASESLSDAFSVSNLSSQSKETHRALVLGLDDQVRNSHLHSRPLCVVQLHRDAEASTSADFAQKLLSFFYLPSRVLRVETDQDWLQAMEPDNASRQILAAVQRHFEEHADGAVILPDIDKLLSPERLLFALCDDDQALQPRATILLTVAAPVPPPGAPTNVCTFSSDTVTKAARSKLQHWTGFPELWSRVSNLVVFPSHSDCR